MVGLDADHVLLPGERRNPLLWVRKVAGVENHLVDVSDDVMKVVFGDLSRGQRLKSIGHDEDGVHFLLTRGGTGLHNDIAYLRYSCQLVLRNDDTRIRGLPRYDRPDHWNPPLVAGVMYCLDTHSPHQGVPDPRMGDAVEPRRREKAVIAVDRPWPLGPWEAWPLLQRYLEHQIADFPITTVPPRWRSGP
jgi:hypothetical protein